MRYIFLCIMGLSFTGLKAEVIESSEHGFIIRTVVEIDAGKMDVWEDLTRNVDQWWDPEHSYSLDASNFYMEPRANGCFCEQLANGGSVLHMLVSHVNPGKTLRLLGGMGPLQEMGIHGAMTFSLKEMEDGKTQLTMNYAVTGFVPGGLQALAPIVDQVMAGQVNRLKKFAEKE